MKVAIVGAGFGGIAMGIALKRAGIDFEIYERAEGIGGVWLQNTYPGAACDIPSYLYSLSYAQRRDWSRPCSPQAEILDYLRDVAGRYGVTERVRTLTPIANARFEATALRWELESADGERFEADALVIACGQLSRPAWPRIEGMDDFAGHSFHSAHWDHEYDLRGKRVAVIGTGASAVQFVPPVAERAARVDIYQRTAPWMMPRRNKPYAPWVRKAIAHVPGLQRVRRAGIWGFGELLAHSFSKSPALRRVFSAWSSGFMRIQVRDRTLRKRIKPDYPFGCKRILFSSDYLPALQRPNVELITDRIERIGDHGPITADGVEREVDCLIYSTGFKTGEFVVPMSVQAADGRELQEVWKGGARAHLGIAVAGFPNMFMLYGPNTNLGSGSIVVMLEAQVEYVMQALKSLPVNGTAAIEVRPETQAAFDERVQERLGTHVWSACESWYRLDGDGRNTSNWPGYVIEYVRATKHLRPEEYRLVEAPAG
jgi:cation diffusion facilitator CzcD-associated flavoprotein CzcO